jgi:serine protease Do
MPSVVNVYSTRVVKSAGRMPFFLDPFMRRFFGRRGKRAPMERKMKGLGSGVILSDDGYIMTNYHVVAKASDIRVALPDKRKFKAEVKGKDPRTDLALIKIEATGLTPVRFGRSSELKVGDVVLAVGNPFGVGVAVSMGIVSAVGRAGMGITDYEDFIQTDAAINPGNSGGALVNMKGELVGIPTAILSRTGGYQGIGFAIPSDLARPIFKKLRLSGKVDRGYLGVSIQEVTPAIAKAMGVQPGKGVLIGQVQPDTPAAKAGLKSGDLIVEMNGKEVQSVHRFRNRVAAKGEGTEVALVVLRDGKRMKLKVKLGALPEQDKVAALRGRGRSRSRRRSQTFEGPKETPMSGVTLARLDAKKRKLLQVPKKVRGLVVMDVESGSPAAFGGLRKGDVILQVNKAPTPNAQAFRKALKKSKRSIFILVWRKGHTLYLAWRLPR